MSAESAADRGDLGHLRIDLLRRAAEIYLEHAYPTGAIPDAVRRRLEWTPGATADILMKSAPFEKTGRDIQTGATIHALRLGNACYPHMKLQIQPWPNSAGFLLSVNTHDQVLGLAPDSPDLDAFRAVQSENQWLKEHIETAWDHAGLPTFLRYLRDYLHDRDADVAATHPAG